MATQAQIYSFINEIAPLAQKAYKTLGKVHPSICIAMACVECAYGTAGSVKNHSYLGQKVGTGKTATKYWNKKFFTSKTKEEYTIGTHTIITSAFRAYDSMEQCVFNYYELLNTSLYSRVNANVHYTTQMHQIKDCGYMTSSTEVNSVISIIAKYNLTKYDCKSVVNISQSVENKILPTLRMGDRNEYVLAWQKYLNLNGYVCGDEDGIFGKNTYLAVKDWQSSHGLSSDGVIGANTWAKLMG